MGGIIISDGFHIFLPLVCHVCACFVHTHLPRYWFPANCSNRLNTTSAPCGTTKSLILCFYPFHITWLQWKVYITWKEGFLCYLISREVKLHIPFCSKGKKNFFPSCAHVYHRSMRYRNSFHYIATKVASVWSITHL